MTTTTTFYSSSLASAAPFAGLRGGRPAPVSETRGEAQDRAQRERRAAELALTYPDGAAAPPIALGPRRVADPRLASGGPAALSAALAAAAGAQQDSRQSWRAPLLGASRAPSGSVAEVIDLDNRLRFRGCAALSGGGGRVVGGGAHDPVALGLAAASSAGRRQVLVGGMDALPETGTGAWRGGPSESASWWQAREGGGLQFQRPVGARAQ